MLTVFAEAMVETDHEIVDDTNDYVKQNISRRKSSLKRIDWRGPEETLYDREQQQQALHDAYCRCQEQAEIALITGASGTGKTVLANTLTPLVEADGGMFLKGKFDQHQYSTALSPCFRAFRFFAKRILARGKEEAELVRNAIEQELGSEIIVLLDLIPELAELLTPEAWEKQQQARDDGLDSDDMDSSISSGCDAGEISESQARVVAVYRRFLRCASSRERPIILFLDDLQVGPQNQQALSTGVFPQLFILKRMSYSISLNINLKS